MEILAKRSLTYVDDSGSAGDLVLTIFEPFLTDRGVWKGGFTFGPPIQTNVVIVAGIDFIQVLVGTLQIALGHLRGTRLRGRVLWRGKDDCGLPWHNKAKEQALEPDLPSSESIECDLRALTTRDLGYCDENNVERKVVLTLFAPIAANNGSWKCGIAFDHNEGGKVRYGHGADYVEAILDALAIARLAFSSISAKGTPLPDSSDLLDCAGLPRRIDGAFFLDPTSSDAPSPT